MTHAPAPPGARPARTLAQLPPPAHGGGGNFANICGMALASDASTLSGVCGALPEAVARQTACLVFASYMSITSVPTRLVFGVDVPVLVPRPAPPLLPHPPTPRPTEKWW